MARYTGPVCKLCRAVGMKLYLKGIRCSSPKCAIERRNFRPGVHGQARQKLSEYAIRLKEKQKARWSYGVLEKQFRRTFSDASRATGNTGAKFLELLERRLDNVVYRLGFATSRAQARQWVNHGHFAVNGRRVSIPSYRVRPGDAITVMPNSAAFVKEALEAASLPQAPKWLEANRETLAATVKALPEREDIDTPVQELLIVEFYSR
ncbi:MAG: 30S ribosomal protein S4 [Aphanocapsa lilacina HA4352-LM1]|jgi:small subunit ribosomal protein S4|uniref:Small ribosomal subunit protein uS4 n=2 Tax=Gloeobacter TaxID=33071 RepID=RS4_GLOVI|nr:MULTISPECIES: 30S ribosomal protein S4 [Gloeobacter]Q7NFF4.1 RecName: Full=Small ribosomal subunit protein uS4; AltName: Full=30S ribosomal protein S4 [Gloeobacter violaceus PCC 7421]MBW4699739.1 30S ribosomal protein S4 [Aphanocapsa lilacina HA4352-LM1]UFP94998.1 30S ribosomal protein S4 [Gloeobacter morelensis MG652769]BAC91513.1 30S ribosomal protein S4 [Gloeobacter violaceus PCC 7421]